MEHEEMMKVECLLELDMGDETRARNINASIEMEHGGYARSWVEGTVLKVQCEAKSMPSMLHTLEDLMACLKVADEVSSLDEE